MELDCKKMQIMHCIWIQVKGSCYSYLILWNRGPCSTTSDGVFWQEWRYKHLYLDWTDTTNCAYKSIAVIIHRRTELWFISLQLSAIFKSWAVCFARLWASKASANGAPAKNCQDEGQTLEEFSSPFNCPVFSMANGHAGNWVHKTVEAVLQEPILRLSSIFLSLVFRSSVLHR